MRLDGIHHITAICSDAQSNLDFYSGVLGLRLVKKTVNFDAPDIYHLYYGDEAGNPGSILTFFEFPGVERGATGPGMVERILWSVSGAEALDHWESRLEKEGVQVARTPEKLEWEDPEGLKLGAVADGSQADHHLRQFHGVTAHIDPGRSRGLLTDVLGFNEDAGRFTCSDAAFQPTESSGPSIQGAGTIHHIAWACEPEDQAGWRERVAQAGGHVTEMIDRQYFFSIYFREPSGVLFEIATKGPGFTVDEPSEALGESLCLPPRYETMRAELESTLKPLRLPADVGGQ